MAHLGENATVMGAIELVRRETLRERDEYDLIEEEERARYRAGVGMGDEGDGDE